MGSAFGGGTQTTTTKPWKPQRQYLKSGFTRADQLYQDRADTPWYGGDLHAGLDPQTQSGVAGFSDYANGAGQDAINNVSATGSDLLGSRGQYLSSIGSFRDAASADPTQSNIASAGAYADNPYLSGQIDAASRDVTRNLYENDIPGINRAATGSGNINSSRAGVAEGIARRGAQDQIGDIASSMRGEAWSNGTRLAEMAREANLSGQGQAAGLYGNALNTGLDATSTARDMMVGNLNNLIQAGKISQEDAQKVLDANLMRWDKNDTRAQDALDRYWGVVGSNNWGSTSTTKGGGPGVLGGLLGTGLSIASMGKDFGLFK